MSEAFWFAPVADIPEYSILASICVCEERAHGTNVALVARVLASLTCRYWVSVDTVEDFGVRSEGARGGIRTTGHSLREPNQMVR